MEQPLLSQLNLVDNVEKTTNYIIKNVDLVGSGLEGFINDWNRQIEMFGKIIKSESIVDLLVTQYNSINSSVWNTSTWAYDTKNLYAPTFSLSNYSFSLGALYSNSSKASVK